MRITPPNDAVTSVPIACRLDERRHKMAEGKISCQAREIKLSRALWL